VKKYRFVESAAIPTVGLDFRKSLFDIVGLKNGSLCSSMLLPRRENQMKLS